MNRRALIVILLVVGGALAAPPVAGADPQVGSGEVGSMDVTTVEGSPGAGPIAGCDVAGPVTAATDGVQSLGVATFGPGGSSCAHTLDTDTISVTATGTDFTLYALSGTGAGTISIEGYQADCSATGGGSRAGMSLSGVRGVDVPSRIPSNYTVTIPGRDGETVATVVLNAIRFGDRGRVDLDAARITLHGDAGAAADGELVLGSVRCAPPL